MQTSVVRVNPGGTGNPMEAISARFAPFPPRRFFMSARPSAWKSTVQSRRNRKNLSPRANPQFAMQHLKNATLIINHVQCFIYLVCLSHANFCQTCASLEHAQTVRLGHRFLLGKTWKNKRLRLRVCPGSFWKGKCNIIFVASYE